jgi:hypothetical protein
MLRARTSVSRFVEDMSRNKCFLSGFEYHMFYVLYLFVTYLLTLPRMRKAAMLNKLIANLD